jgi:hypothetical protein
MKLSKSTVEVLRNFSNINSNIAIGDSGSVRTVAIAKNLMGKAEIPEEFPYKFGIYDLNEFLSCYSMFDDPSLGFDDNQKFVTITDGISAVKYFFSDIDNLTVTDKDVTMPDTVVNFTITNDELNKIRKASAALKANDLVVTKNTDGGVWTKLTVTDKENPTSNEFSLNIANCNIDTDENFEFVFNINNFKFNATDKYTFEIASKLISAVKAGDTNYWLALEKTSTYGV